MKITSSCILTLVTALVGLCLAASLSPTLRAQAASHTPDQGSAIARQPIGSAANAADSQNGDSSSSSQTQLTAVAIPDPAPQAASAPSSSAPAAPAQDQTPAAATPPAPLAMPSMTAPLSTAAPAHTFDAGPFGTVAVTGILSGMGMIQNNWVPGDQPSHWDVSNAQVFVQKTTGWWQFYFQGGAYNLPDLGLPFISTNKTLPDFFGPLPIGYLKLVKGGFSVEVGELPTLIGAEYTFSFENTNIERGLLWNQETLPTSTRPVSLTPSRWSGSGSCTSTPLTSGSAFSCSISSITADSLASLGSRWSKERTPTASHSRCFNVHVDRARRVTADEHHRDSPAAAHAGLRRPRHRWPAPPAAPPQRPFRQ